jgi:glucokinase
MSVAGAFPADACVAVDIGATKAEVALVAGGRVRARERVASREAGEALLDSLVTLVDSLGADHPNAPVGVACAGPLRDGGEFVSPLNLHQWRDFPLRARLAERTGRRVAVDGDVRALARSEWRVGAAVGLRDFLSMVVSTGVGGALVLDGRLLDGRTGNAGHVGHLTVVPGGAPCGCGARGCLEAEASGLALEALTGGDPSRADAAVRDRVAQLVGRAVGTLAAVLDFRACFVAGSVALGFGEEFFSSATRAAREVARLDYAREVTIAPSALGPDGALLGAALVALDGDR